MQTLADLAAYHQLHDQDILRLARTDLPPNEAVADLKSRFPTAFGKRAKDMSPAEFRALEKKLLAPEPQKIAHADKMFADMTAREQEEFERSIGRTVSWGDIIARRRREAR